MQGVGPTAQRAGIIAAVELPIYDYSKQRLMSAVGDNVANHFMWVENVILYETYLGEASLSEYSIYPIACGE